MIVGSCYVVVYNALVRAPRALALFVMTTLLPISYAWPRLRVAPGGRYLMTDSGQPFFYLGDTAWELFHRLDRKDADLYLEDRARKGFTVIQAVVLAELDGLRVPNAYGHLPLLDFDPTRPAIHPGPENDYWDHVDYIVNRAEQLGLYIGMLPTWGDKWVQRWGAGPEIFTPENAEQYGAFLGRRYRDKPIIWILGGDRNPDNERHLAIIRAMARGLRQGDGGVHLMTYHPQGGASSSQWFHRDDWLDFNLFQSGHHRLLNPNWEMTLHDRALEPPKPVIDGEPCYEDHPVNWHRDGEKRWFDEWDVRRAAYCSMLAGAAGHTYGNHNIWQFWQPGREPISLARTPWRRALNHPGAWQMGYLRELLTQRSFHRLEPDQSLIASDAATPAEQARAALAQGGDYGLIYLPTGKPVRARLNKLRGSRVRAWWFNPRQGVAELIGEFSAQTSVEFTPPTSGRNNDWVLVLDSLEADLAPLEPASLR